MKNFSREAGLGLGVLFIFILMAAQALAAPSAEEAAFRARLGIPAEAKKVIVFAQSSHVDADWLFTADQYQKLFTDKTFDKMLVELKRDPRYVYTVECVFFFKRYWDSHPQNQADLRKFANEGRIRWSGTGITTADSLLPEPENLIRDYLVGREWLKKQGINTDPKIAYIPDSFGESPSFPSILREIGYKYMAMSRIDGMYFIGTDYGSPKKYPTPGSSAELLLKKYKTLDFVWQGPDKSEVLTHWEAFTYSQADMVAYHGIAILFTIPLGVPALSAREKNANIDSYIKQLAPLSPTGYMFCPLGSDFNPPQPNLNKILDDYNKMRYPKSGTYAVLATLEDYLKLVEFHKDQLPVVALDPNPLFEGYYASRPELKQRCRKLSRSLVLAETLGLMEQDRQVGKYPDLSVPWHTSLFSDHHDFISGTSREAVYHGEQLFLLKKAQAIVDDYLLSFANALKPVAGIVPKPVSWHQDGQVVTIENDFYQIIIDGKAGGCITHWLDKKTGREILSGPSNDVIFYFDSGGLWRMGQELTTGKFRMLAKASDSPATVTAQESKGVLAVTSTNEVKGKKIVRTVFFRADRPEVRMKLRGAVPKRTDATACFRTKVNPGSFVQELPYGIVDRPVHKNYTPTFWAVKNWVDLTDKSQSFGVNLALTAPASVNANPDGTLQLIALHYGSQEKIMGIPVLAFPASGADPDEHEIDYAFWPHGSDDWLTRRVYLQAKDAVSDSWTDPQKPDLDQLAATLTQTDRPDVMVTAVKKAESGEGVVVRLFKYSEGTADVRLSYAGKPVKQAFLADGLERKLEQLPVKDGKVAVQMPYALATVLLSF